MLPNERRIKILAHCMYVGYPKPVLSNEIIYSKTVLEFSRHNLKCLPRLCMYCPLTLEYFPSLVCRSVCLIQTEINSSDVRSVFYTFIDTFLIPSEEFITSLFLGIS